MPKILAFDDIEDKHDVYKGYDSMNKIRESMKKHAIKILDFKNKNNTVISAWIICESKKKSHLHINFEYKYADYKKYFQDTDLVIIQVNTEVPHIPYVIVYPKDIVYR